MKPASLTPAKIRGLLETDVLREGVPAFAKRANVAESTVRNALKSEEIPGDAILTALGVLHEHTYTMAKREVVESATPAWIADNPALLPPDTPTPGRGE